MQKQGEVIRSIKLDFSRLIRLRDQDGGPKETHSGETSVGSVAGGPALGGMQTIRPNAVPTAITQ